MHVNLKGSVLPRAKGCGGSRGGGRSDEYEGTKTQRSPNGGFPQSKENTDYLPEAE